MRFIRPEASNPRRLIAIALLSFSVHGETFANPPSEQPARPLLQLEAHLPALARVQGEERYRALMLSSIAVFDTLNSIRPKYRKIIATVPAEHGTSQALAMAAARFTVLTSVTGVDHAVLKRQFDSIVEQEKDLKKRQAAVRLGRQIGLEVLRIEVGQAEHGSTPVTILDGDCPAPLVAGNRLSHKCEVLLRQVLDPKSENYLVASPTTIPAGPGYHTPPSPNKADRRPAARILLGKPFAVPAAMFDTLEPIPFDGPEALADAREVLTFGGKRSPARTAAQSEAALFWNSGGPGDELQFIRHVVDKTSPDLLEEARILALEAIAAYDTFYHVMKLKVKYQRWRPETAIAGKFSLSGVSDPSWSSLVHAAIDSEFPSGLTALLGAQVTILRRFSRPTEDLIKWRNTSLNMTREWNSWDQVELEAAQARIHAGVHFRHSAMVGLRIGQQVSQRILESVALPLGG